MSTLVTWAFAPAWLTLAEAAALTGYDEDTLRAMVADSDVDTRLEGDKLLIEKASLREFQEAWLDWRAVQLDNQDDA
ncbi:MAG: helix-turn-helix domain-containing protein [Anaerolineae bacterium]|nr:helix-turn-helix domain-containing protein [Anaerolineae bacterium]